MEMNVHASARVALSLAAVLTMAVPAGAQDGFSWRSFAEVGGGISLTGSAPKPLASLESGILIGVVDLGGYVQLLPLEFGRPDLIQAAAVAYGGSLGYTLDTGANIPKPFGRIGLGGVYKARANEDGGFSGIGVGKKFSGVLTLGVSMPINGRWSARLWGSYRLTDDARDYEGASLSGFGFGASVRAQWTTTIR